MRAAVLLLIAALLWSGPARGQDLESALEQAVTARGQPTFDELFRVSAIRLSVLSPSGEYAAYASYGLIYAGNPEVGFAVVESTERENPFTDIEWAGDDLLLVWTRNRRTGESLLHALEVGVVDGGFQQIRHKVHSVAGYVHDPIIDDPEHIVLAVYEERNERFAADLFHFNVFEDRHRQLRHRNRLVKDADYFIYFQQDAAGEFVLGLGYESRRPHIWQRQGERRTSWEHIWSGPEDADFIPMGLSEDGQTLWALSNATTDKLAAVAFDVTTAQISEVLYEHPRFDLQNLLFADTDNPPIGVSYVDAGLLRYEYFDESYQQRFDILEELLPEARLIVTGYSPDWRNHLVVAAASDDPGSLQLCRVAERHCDVISSIRPWLDKRTLAETVPLQIQSSDGLVVDAFLTLPVQEAESYPLLAMPHGGPIGVSDDQYFSGDVQWLSQNGYAVLQVNYRGSAGYGRSFMDAGLRAWGRGIEQDILASIEHALDAYPVLDRDRIGILGSSYGGYSALISVIEHPEVFVCAASFAGVTDLTLLFNRTRMRQSPRMRDRLIEMIGDPDVDYEELTRFSPVYQYTRIDRPIFLAHGSTDRVVDVEHSWRLKTMLELIDREPEFLVIDEVGHGLPYVEDARKLYAPLVAFLDRHLKPASETGESPTDSP